MDNFKKELEQYEKPIAEIVEFAIEESIAVSANLASGAMCSENLFGIDGE